MQQLVYIHIISKQYRCSQHVTQIKINHKDIGHVDTDYKQYNIFICILWNKINTMIMIR